MRQRAKKLLERRRRRAGRGVALIMVLGALTILTVMLTEFQEDTAAELGSAVSERDQLKAEYAARSAVNLSRLLIASEPEIRKSLLMFAAMMGGAMPQLPVWEYSDKVLGAFNDSTGTRAFANLASVDIAEGKNLGMEGAGFSIQIVDEDAKINLNTAARPSANAKTRLATQIAGLISGPQYGPLFSNRDADGQYSDRQTICAAIIDWTDMDQDQDPCDPHSATAQQTGPEDSFYQLLDDPYPRKNAAFDSLEELRLVRGISDDFWATFVEPDHEDPTRRTVTVWGQGQVNVNTADAFTLWALICGYRVPGTPTPVCDDPVQITTFISLVNMIRGFTRGMPMFTTPKGFTNFIQGRGRFKVLWEMAGTQIGGLAPVRLVSEKLVQDATSTESKVFSIYATGRSGTGKNEARVRIHSVVDFRGAPPPGAPPFALPTAPTGQPGTTPPQPASTASSPGLPDGLTADSIAAAFRKDPGGNVVYFKVE